MHIGFAGLGRMGAVMAPRLLDAGHQLIVWNRTPAKAQILKDRGATVAASPAGLAAADIIITIMTDDKAVSAFYDGLLTASVQGKLLIDMSTLTPEMTHRLAARASAAGAAFVDSPVSGTVLPARDGKLLALAGGTADDLARAKPVLDLLCRRIIHAGPAGSGALLKLVINLPLAVYWASLAEAIGMGRQGGLDPALMLEAIKDSAAALAVIGLKTPAILGEPGPVAFDVASMQKDLRAILQTAGGASMLTATAALSSYTAAADHGLKDEDAVAVVRFITAQMNHS